MKYYYTRAEITDGIWDINHPFRINKYNKKVSLAEEIQNKFQGISFIFFAGYDNDPTKAMVDFKDITLSNEEKELLDMVVGNHKSNIADKYAIKHMGELVPNPEKTEEAILFDTPEGAQQGIIVMELNPADCEIVPIVVL
jgi:hypothetical protein